MTKGYKYYPTSYGVKVTRASGEVYYTTISVKGYFSELLHGWLSAEMKAEAYNETHRNTEKEGKNLNPTKGVHFNKKRKEEKSDDFCSNDDLDDIEEHNDTGTQYDKGTISRMWEMRRKSLKQVFYNYEMIK